MITSDAILYTQFKLKNVTVTASSAPLPDRLHQPLISHHWALVEVQRTLLLLGNDLSMQRNYEWLYARYEQSLLKEREVEVRPEVVKEVVTVK